MYALEDGEPSRKSYLAFSYQIYPEEGIRTASEGGKIDLKEVYELRPKFCSHADLLLIDGGVNGRECRGASVAALGVRTIAGTVKDDANSNGGLMITKAKKS